MVGERRLPVPKILCQTDPLSFEIADFQSTFARSALAVTPIQKVQL